MVDMFHHWYKRHFSDPHAVSLIALLVISFLVIYFMGHVLAPFLVAIVLAYLLEWPVSRLSKIGVPRTLAVISVLLIFIGLMTFALLGLSPIIWHQVSNLVSDIPTMFNDFQHFLSMLPHRYPDLIEPHFMVDLMTSLRDKVLVLGESLLKVSLSSLVSLATLGVYLILVPLLVFFMLKDKKELLTMLGRVLPKNRRLTARVSVEMNQQISNYIRGKVIEILVVGIATYLVFFFMDMRYSVLLAVLVGLSVLIPYIGAAAVTVPVAMVALFQWGITPEFWWLLIAYGVVQALDGNVLVPVLFSEAVNLHPVMIIVSVLVFGGFWGFWGVFFAIPLATLVKAVWHALQYAEEAI